MKEIKELKQSTLLKTLENQITSAPRTEQKNNFGLSQILGNTLANTAQIWLMSFVYEAYTEPGNVQVEHLSQKMDLIMEPYAGCLKPQIIPWVSTY